MIKERLLERFAEGLQSTHSPYPMRVAVLSDIHANLEALEAVLGDAWGRDCTGFICLGDIVGFNADPAACIDIVRRLGCPVVKGDFDESHSGNGDLSGMNPTAGHATAWTRQQLDEEQHRWLEELPLIHQAGDLTAVHSSLDHPAEWGYAISPFDAMSSFAHQITRICFYGHTHVPRVYRKTRTVEEIPAGLITIERDAKYFINAGSVGMARDGDWRACYVIYDEEAKTVEFHRVEYDLAAVQRKVIAAGLPP